jgi:orotidine-5'-phosphate decarboxylase
MTTFDPGNRLIAALDVGTASQADQLVARLGGVPGWVKIGLELFCAAGPALVAAHVQRGLSVMLDLKLHDIPETVARATGQVAGLGAGLLTVHASGGRAMLEACVAAAQDAGETRILAVTVLTSLDQSDLDAIGDGASLPALVLKRALLAQAAGCHGVVASPHEVASLRRELGPEFLLVTPGIRPAGVAAGDQKRVMTPGEARRAGADLVVVGRPLRDAPDPAAVARDIVRELATAGAGSQA